MREVRNGVASADLDAAPAAAAAALAAAPPGEPDQAATHAREPDQAVAGAAAAVAAMEGAARALDADVAAAAARAVYGERFADKARRVKGQSPHGRRPGWAVRPIIVKSGDDCRQVQHSA